ncbi:MAG TPA: FKBP-type peptidyl-prolyl cis-trans isomerase [Tepidisphaeraceae bacterium]|jgi:hypothetical protein
MIESLENRTHLSATTPRELTTTALKVTAGQLGQAITFDVTVRTNAKFGSPTGTVDLVDHGTVIQTLTLAPTTSANPRLAASSATITMPAGAGNPDYYVGAHAVRAQFNSTGAWVNSKGAAVFAVKQPKYVRQADGVKIATVEAGSGPTISAGQSATMMYTGYLASNGKIFDYSGAHSPDTFTFTVEASPEQVIPGFDQAVVGMQVGETRAVYVPSALGYGKEANGSIPANSNLVFLITLESIS